MIFNSDVLWEFQVMHLEVCSRCQSGPLLIPGSLRKIQANGSTDLFAPTAKTRGFHTQLDEGPETP